MSQSTEKENFLWRLILYILGRYHLEEEIIIPFDSLENELDYCFLRYLVNQETKQILLKAEAGLPGPPEDDGMAAYRKIWRWSPWKT